MTRTRTRSKMALEETWPKDRLTRLDNFGHSMASPAYLYRPAHIDQLVDLIEACRARGQQLGLRGASRSYGDAALNAGGVVVDFRRMNRILDWDPVRGIIRVEPGVTIEQLWKYVLEDGWWPPVVPGTMAPTLGGCLAMNIHGKNNYRAGPLGEHVISFEALLTTGEVLHCSPKENSELYHAMIGGLGVLGIFRSITLQMKRVYSGELWVKAWAAPHLTQMVDEIETHKSTTDYLVGWVDTTARGAGLGRGQLHSADYLTPEEDERPAVTLSEAYQDLPDTIFGLVPKSMIWKFMRPFMNNLGYWAINTAKYWTSRTISHQKRFRQSMAAFNFLLDYVPNWEWAFLPGGLIQYQSFIPKDYANAVFSEMLRLSQRRGTPSYLAVIKRHRPDPFLLTHAVDGYSLALDFRVTRGNRAALNQLSADFNRLVLEADGRLYFAKDSTLTPDVVDRFLGEETINAFLTLKRRVDPDGILTSDLFRRCFANHL